PAFSGRHLMIRINLLPVKAAARIDTAKQELMLVAVAVLVVGLGLFIWNMTLNSEIDEAKQRIAKVKVELEKLEKDVVRVEKFKKDAEVLEKKLEVIANLKKQKVGPAKMLDDLSTILTELERVWLTKLEEKGGTLHMEGSAMEEADISAFQTALKDRSKFFDLVQLQRAECLNANDVIRPNWRTTCRDN